MGLNLNFKSSANLKPKFEVNSKDECELDRDIVRHGWGHLDMRVEDNEKKIEAIRDWVRKKYDDSYQIDIHPSKRSITIYNQQRMELTSVLNTINDSIERDVYKNKYCKCHFSRNLNAKEQQWAVEFYQHAYPNAYNISFHNPRCLILELRPQFENFDRNVKNVVQNIWKHGEIFVTNGLDYDSIDHERFTSHIKQTLGTHIYVSWDNIRKGHVLSDFARLNFLEQHATKLAEIRAGINRHNFAKIRLDRELDNQQITYIREHLQSVHGMKYNLYHDGSRKNLCIVPFDIRKIQDLKSSLWTMFARSGGLQMALYNSTVITHKERLGTDLSSYTELRRVLNDIDENINRIIAEKQTKIRELEASIEEKKKALEELRSSLPYDESLREENIEAELNKYIQNTLQKEDSLKDYYDFKICSLKIKRDFYDLKLNEDRIETYNYSINEDIVKNYHLLQKEFNSMIHKLDAPGILIIDIETPDLICSKHQILSIGVAFWDIKTKEIKKVCNIVTKPSDFEKISDTCWLFKNSDLSVNDFNNIPETKWDCLTGINPITNKIQNLKEIISSFPITGFNIKSFDIPRLQAVGLIDKNPMKINIPFDLGRISRLIMGRKHQVSVKEIYKFIFRDYNYENSHNVYNDVFDEAKILNEIYIHSQDLNNFANWIKVNEEQLIINTNNIRKEGENLTYNYAKEILSFLFKKPIEEINFQKNIRPKWLEYLELDLFWEEKKIAFEYNGQQHYCFNRFYHKNIKCFEDLKKRDVKKRTLCIKNGITLIEIPYFVPIKDMQDWIYFNLKLNSEMRNKLYEKTRVTQNYEKIRKFLEIMKLEKRIEQEYLEMPVIDWSNFPTYSILEEQRLIDKLEPNYSLRSHFLGMKKPIIIECDACKQRGEKNYTYITTPYNIYRSQDYLDQKCYQYQREQKLNNLLIKTQSKLLQLIENSPVGYIKVNDKLAQIKLSLNRRDFSFYIDNMAEKFKSLKIGYIYEKTNNGIQLCKICYTNESKDRINDIIYPSALDPYQLKEINRINKLIEIIKSSKLGFVTSNEEQLFNSLDFNHRRDVVNFLEKICLKNSLFHISYINLPFKQGIHQTKIYYLNETKHIVESNYKTYNSVKEAFNGLIEMRENIVYELIQKYGKITYDDKEICNNLLLHPTNAFIFLNNMEKEKKLKSRFEKSSKSPNLRKFYYL